MRLCAIRVSKRGGWVRVMPQFKVPSGATVSDPTRRFEGYDEQSVVAAAMSALVAEKILKE